MASKIDMSEMSAAELTQLIDEANALLGQKREEAKTELLQEMRAKATAIGIDISELVTSPRTNVRKVRSDVGKSLTAKYKSPNGETWTGRGRMPRWLSEAERSGKSREEFRV
jgi:DNA-binding protein H-NS